MGSKPVTPYIQVKGKQGDSLALTGRRRSRSHQIAWLVCAAEAPNTRMGSHRTRHSQMDHKFDNDDSKRSSGDGTNGAVVARICEDWSYTNRYTEWYHGLTWFLGSYLSLNDEVSVSCWASDESGISTCITDPKKPSSNVPPGLGSCLCFASWESKKKRTSMQINTYQVAMLWHAASSIGVPCCSKRGPNIDARWVKKAGNWCWVRITRERCGGGQ